MRDRIYFKVFLTIFVLVSLSYTGKSNQSKDLKMKVGIFQIPPYQSVVWNEPSPKTKEGVTGGIRGTMTGGNVTGSFPDGIVLCETDRFPNNEDLYKVIKEKVKFPDLTRILPVGNIYFLIDTTKLDATVIDKEVEMYPSRRRHLMKEFSLQFMPVAVEGGEAVIDVKFSVQIDEDEPDKKKLLDQTFGVPHSRTLLVGFPTNDERGRGTVYWLAFSIEN
jgi:hypothetical protein